MDKASKKQSQMTIQEQEEFLGRPIERNLKMEAMTTEEWEAMEAEAAWEAQEYQAANLKKA
jgi:hypothetical protein